MEVIQNLVTGCFVPRADYNLVEFDSEDDEAGDEMTWLGYNEVSSVNKGKSFVQYERPKYTKGDLIDLHTKGKMEKVSGMFHLEGQWWQTTILRTKKTPRRMFREPHDGYALCYRLRDDEGRFKHKVLDLFLSKVQNIYEHDSNFIKSRAEFEQNLRYTDQFESTDPGNIEERLVAFVDSMTDEGDKQRARFFMEYIVQSSAYKPIVLSKTHPQLLHYLPQLFPNHFNTLVCLEMKKLDTLAEMLDQEPGLLAFKPIVSKKCGILGCETSYEALKMSGLLTKVSQEVHDAILMYEMLKKESKNYGHTGIQFDRVLEALSQVIVLYEEALEFLNKNKVTKTQMEGGYRIVYLMNLWKYENKIALGINSLISRNELNPWELEVDWDKEDLESICQDNDQSRAAKLITEHPVVAISGKGGCGKTYVVTKVITSAKDKLPVSEDKNPQQLDNDADTPDPMMNDETGVVDDWMNCNHDNKDTKEKPPAIKLLLTAPTGKAANLLGKRAGCASYTLHQVIFSHRMLKPEQEWKHKDVNILVVDECSLVAVSTFSYLIQLLLDEAKLRRVILLGDIRQLPSIEPGNFLEDTFTALSKLGCAVELRTNHRAESQIIVDNATRISKKMYPNFHKEKFILRKLPDIDPTGPDKHYHDQDVSQEVIRLLQHPDLKSDVNSQFISFKRKICDIINDQCCHKYSQHRTMDNKKRVFRVNDKVCCTKNGYVSIYEDVHGYMSSKKKKVTKKKAASGEDAAVTEDKGSCHSDVGMDRILDGSEELEMANVEHQDLQQSLSEKKEEEDQKIRLCNGEIFFILDEVERADDSNTSRTFLLLSDKDPDEELQFWVDKKEIRKTCKLRHAWARTIHTFQGSETDNVVYIVGDWSKYQNWQHVYTAITRGRKSVFILGQERILRGTIKRSEVKRKTSLKKQLVERFQKRSNYIGTQVPKESKQPIPAETPCQTSLLRALFQSPSKESPVPGTSGISSRGRGGNSKSRSRLSLTHTRARNKATVASDGHHNTTQEMTDILTKLAEGHGDDDIEEYMSDEEETPLPGGNIKLPDTRISSATTKAAVEDAAADSAVESEGSDSQSLLSGPSTSIHSKGKSLSKPKTASKVSNQQFTSIKPFMPNTHHQGEVEMECDQKGRLKDIAVQEVDADTETDDSEDSESEESQSLLVPPSIQKSVQAQTRGSSVLGDMKGARETARSLSQIGVPLCKVGQRQSIGGLKERYDTHSPVTPIGGSGLSRYITAQTLQSGGKVASPLTPLTTGHGRSIIQKTSSPLDPDGNHFHIHTGMSPLTPSFGNMSATKPSNSFLNSSYIPPTSAEKRDIADYVDDIQEPKSNDSQWSEIDESELVKLDASASQFSRYKQANTSGYKGNSSALNVSNKASTSLRQISSRSALRAGHVTDVSANSLWSDIGDDNYLGLSLDDITNMAEKGPHGNTSTTSTLADNHSNYSKQSTPYSNHGNLSRNLSTVKDYGGSPIGHSVGSVKQGTGSKVITPTGSRDEARSSLPTQTPSPVYSYRQQGTNISPCTLSPTSPGSPSHHNTSPYLSSNGALRSPGVKRQLSNQQEWSPKKPNIQTDPASFVSPLKNSLSKLDFNS